MATGHHPVFGHDAKRHWVFCDDCDTVLFMGKHMFATWSKNGVKHFECKVCEYGYTKKIPTQQGVLDFVPKTGDR